MAKHPSPRAMIERLVAFDTVSSNSNMALINDVADYLDGHGARVRVLANEDGSKANLFASLGPSGAGGVCLSGHTDVVPVADQAWQSDPFAVVERDGRLFGRGTSDMKSFIAIALSLVPEMTARELSQPIHFALSYDEEVGCVGAPHMIRKIGDELPQPELVIVGEPTEMKVVNASKGIVAVKTTVTGLEAHSSLTHAGVNAIFHAVHLLHYLEQRAEELKADRNEDFDPPYATINVGTIEGGTALNIIPRRCSFRWDFRPLPETDVDAVIAGYERFTRQEVEARMKSTHPEATIESEIGIHVPPLSPADNSPAELLARQLTGDNATHSVSFAAEAGQFQQAGVAAVICGPGSIRQAHQPNEYISLDQVAAGEAFLRKLIDRLST